MRTFSRGALVGVGLALAAGGAAVGQPSPIPPPVPGVPPAAPPVAGVPMTPPAPKSPPAGPPAPPTVIGGKSVEAWVGEFRNDDPAVRELAAKAMHGFAHDAARKAAAKPLLRLMDDKDPGVRINAILAVNALGFERVEDVREAAAKLAAFLDNTRDGSVVRLHAARTLAGFGAEGHKAVPALLRVVDDPSWATRQAVAMALGRNGMAAYEEVTVSDGLLTAKVPKLVRPSNDAAMNALSYRLLRDPSAFVRTEACQALVVLGPPQPANPADYPAKAAPLVKAIQERLAVEKDAGTKIWLQLLLVMYDERQLDAMLKALGTQVASSDPAVRVQALQALAALGPKARPALASVTSAMFQPDAEAYVAAAAVTALVNMGDEAKSGVADLERLVAETKNENLKKLAVQALDLLRKGRPTPAAPVVAVPPAAAKLP